MENLVEVEPLREGPAGATRLSKADIKGKIIEFMWNLKREGYAEATIIGYCKTLEILARRGADLSIQTVSRPRSPNKTAATLGNGTCVRLTQNGLRYKDFLGNVHDTSQKQNSLGYHKKTRLTP